MFQQQQFDINKLIPKTRNNNKLYQKNNLFSSKGKSNQLTVILDLDNTLISSFVLEPESEMCDFLISIEEGEEMFTFGVIKRPNVDSFLKKLSKIATIYLYTSAVKSYASQIIHQIDPVGKYFQKVFTREDCIKISEIKYKKDYTLCGSNMSRTIIVDDIPENFKDFSDNGISIKPFIGNYNDNDLNRVFERILKLSRLNDVRTRG